jgi:hypothetical protein
MVLEATQNGFSVVRLPATQGRAARPECHPGAVPQTGPPRCSASAALTSPMWRTKTRPRIAESPAFSCCQPELDCRPDGYHSQCPVVTDSAMTRRRSNGAGLRRHESTLAIRDAAILTVLLLPATVHGKPPPVGPARRTRTMLATRLHGQRNVSAGGVAESDPRLDPAARPRLEIRRGARPVPRVRRGRRPSTWTWPTTTTAVAHSRCTARATANASPTSPTAASSKGGRPLLGRRLTGQAVLYVARRRGKDAGVTRFSPHDLRRTYVGDLLDTGADLSVVQQLAGHQLISTTARYDRRGEAAKHKAAMLLHVPYSGRHARTARRSGG